MLQYPTHTHPHPHLKEAKENYISKLYKSMVAKSSRTNNQITM